MILLKVAMLIGNLHISLSYYFISPIIVHFHELSHTYATMLYDAGVDVKSAQKFLGHADITTTLRIYTHLSEQKEQAAIDALNVHLTGKL